MNFRFSLTLLLALAAPAGAQQSASPFVVSETGQGYWKLSEAVDAIGGRDGSILIAPGQYAQCAVQREGRITYRARVPGSVIFDGVACDGKAALVLAGSAASVDGIIFQNIHVRDRNGSGIKLEHGNLHVVNSIFRNSDQGILTNKDSASSIVIDHATFSGLGGCPEGTGCSHSIYVGDYGQLTVSNSRFERGAGGHYVKSRSARVDIQYNSFDDTQGHETNYMVDLPEGSTGVIAHNEFVQGESKENYSAFISVGGEEITHSSAGLMITMNRAAIAPGVQRITAFVADKTHEPIRISSNQLGDGIKVYESR